MNDKILIISNSVLSKTGSNGKTLLSYFDSLPTDNIRQLYFSGETPHVGGYKYFRISDIDIIKSKLIVFSKGGEIQPQFDSEEEPDKIKKIPKNSLTSIIREILWWHGWKSKNLIKWLDDFSPTVVFFHAADCIFAHSIYEYVAKKFQPKTAMYFTDDYIMPRSKEALLAKIRRKKIIKSLQKAMCVTDEVFTITDNMKQDYYKLFGRNSNLIVNMTEPLKDENLRKKDERINIVYAGTLYFGRDNSIKKVAESLIKYNEEKKEKIYLDVYTNGAVGQQLSSINDENVHFHGKVNKEELKKIYNQATILLFVESYDTIQMEKTKYSLSTKIPEYLSLQKPILAVGPSEIGSMMYLNDVALCVPNLDETYTCMCQLLNSKELQDELANKAYTKYITNHDKKKLQSELYSALSITTK